MRPSVVVLALSLLLPGLAEADEHPAITRLKRAVAALDPVKIREAAVEVRALDTPEALTACLGLLTKGHYSLKDSSYWALVDAAAGFKSAAALDALGKRLAKGREPWTRDVLFALTRNDTPHRALAIAPALGRKAPYDLQLLAVDVLAAHKTEAAQKALQAAHSAEGNKGDPELRERLAAAIAGTAPKRPTPKKGEVLVISGKLPADHPRQPNVDHDHDAFQALLGKDVPHVVVLRAHFAKDPKRYLKRARCILINDSLAETVCICKQCLEIASKKLARGLTVRGCPPECGRHDMVSYRLTQELVMRLKAWVEKQRGTLITSGWGVVDVIEVAWPRRLRSPGFTDADGKRQWSLTSKLTAATYLRRGASTHPILRGLSPAALPAKLAVLDRTPQLAIGAAVTKLLVSDDLASGGDAVAALTFRAGKAKPKKRKKRKGRSRGKGEWDPKARGGRVIHVLPSTKGSAILKAIVLNAIDEALLR